MTNLPSAEEAKAALRKRALDEIGECYAEEITEDDNVWGTIEVLFGITELRHADPNWELPDSMQKEYGEFARAFHLECLQNAIKKIEGMVYSYIEYTPDEGDFAAHEYEVEPPPSRRIISSADPRWAEKEPGT